MEKVISFLEEQVNECLIQVILSNPRNKESIRKMKIHPVVIKGETGFQIERYIGTKVLHENLKKEATMQAILNALDRDFKQLELESANCKGTVLIGKRGTVSLKRKQKNISDGNKIVPEHNRRKHYILQEGIPVPFLIDLGVQTRDGRIIHAKYDKFRQINRFLEFVRDVLPALPEDRKLSILDFGCGKSYLTFALYYYLRILNHYDIDVVGLDLKEDVIDTCNQLKEKYGYQNLTFLKGDIKEYDEQEQVDMVVTLHACDTATDYALYKAIAWNAKVILSVPCCQHELNKQINSRLLQPVLKYGLLKERLSALLTDGIRANLLERAGYETQILEFIDMEHTPKNILIRAVKKNGFQKRRQNELEELTKEIQGELTLASLLKGKEGF
ncbi:MAG: SAM-dependent methyltransferase [Lachnospiraceae bacterium]|nr:SAM-dependent methyltransferase [Lachnospiraceae bacterium]